MLDSMLCFVNMYTPPFKVTAETINLISEISAQLERFAIHLEQVGEIRLRKINKMKTVRGSLAIEGNTLSEEQVTALIDGKMVIASLREVQEVRNALLVYDKFSDFDPYSINDLLRAHGMMMGGLIDRPGAFRNGNVCVAGKEGITHIAPPANRVSSLISDLFDWTEHSKDHMLIKSSVFHYEFEFIHPFEDGNGRMGRFWQSLLLSLWNPVFTCLPVENMIWENQGRYYEAIEKSTAESNSGFFIDFMLQIILQSVYGAASYYDPVSDLVNDPINDPINDPVNRILSVIREKPGATYGEIAQKIGKSEATVKRILSRLKKENRLIRHGAARNGRWEIVSKT